MTTTLPPLTFDEAFVDGTRMEPQQFTASTWVLPRRDFTEDADRLVAEYRHAAIVRTFERHALTLDAVNELDALLEAYLEKARRNR